MDMDRVRKKGAFTSMRASAPQMRKGHDVDFVHLRVPVSGLQKRGGFDLPVLQQIATKKFIAGIC
jgi:hypothetical protein